MVWLCSARHKGNMVAVDRGTLRWEALTPAGANGPIAWSMDISQLIGGETDWREIARERDIHVYEPLEAWQAFYLKELAGMLV